MKILLCIYDNGSHIHYLPQGEAYIAATLRAQGHEVDVYLQDVHRYHDEHLTWYLDNNHYDVVGLGVVGGYYQYGKMKTIGAAICASKDKPFFVLGGYGPTPTPEYFMKVSGADAVVLGEGERTIVDLVDTLGAGGSLHDVLGLAFMDGETFVENGERPLIQDVDSIPMPAYDLFPMEYYRLRPRIMGKSSDFMMYVLSGRGCPFKCNFCYRMDKGFRARSPEALLHEVRHLQRNYGITYFSFVDDLLMASKKRTIELCEYFIKEKVDFHWQCNGRLNYSTPEMMKLMAAAGCDVINYGVEAFDDQIMRNMKKSLTCAMTVKGVEATLAAGIYPRLNIIFGNIGETPETLEKGVEFLLKYDPGLEQRSIRPVTPYPGAPLYHLAIEQGKLEGPADFYEVKHLNSDLLCTNFTDLTDDEFYRCLLKANTRLLEHYHSAQLRMALEKSSRLYRDRKKVRDNPADYFRRHHRKVTSLNSSGDKVSAGNRTRNLRKLPVHT